VGKPDPRGLFAGQRAAEHAAEGVFKWHVETPIQVQSTLRYSLRVFQLDCGDTAPKKTWIFHNVCKVEKEEWRYQVERNLTREFLSLASHTQHAGDDRSNNQKGNG
jgi:hypothetical protein